MTDHTDEELIALAKKCGAVRSKNIYRAEVDTPVWGVIISDVQLRAFASALRQQDIARMARMREALINCPIYNAPNAFTKEQRDWLNIRAESLSETADMQERMDGQRATVPDEARFFPFEFEVWQHDEMVASSSGPRDDALREAMNYAAQYEQDGPVRIFEVKRWLIDTPSARSTKGEG